MIKKSKTQLLILTLGGLTIVLGIWTMLKTKTIIFPSWYLVLIYLPLTFLFAIGIGFLVKKIFKVHWHTLTITSLIMTIACLIFYISENRPRYTIYIPDNYGGEVMLLVTNETNNDFNINNFGIGYINQKTFKDGFHATVIKNNEDITKQIEKYNRGTYGSSGTLNISFGYMSFTNQGDEKNSGSFSMSELIINNAIDTTRLWRR